MRDPLKNYSYRKKRIINRERVIDTDAITNITVIIIIMINSVTTKELDNYQSIKPG